MEKISAFYWLMRPLNSTTAGVAVVVALHLGIGRDDVLFPPRTYLFAALAAFLVTAHSMVHNDIVDRDIDAINAPLRAIPSGKVSVTQAKLWSMILFILAIGASFLIDLTIALSFPFSIIWATLNMLILDAYNLYLKQSGLFGNLVIGYVTAALFIYADIAVNHGFTLRTESIGLYAFFLVWGREVYKDIIDIEGDRQHGVKTIPVRFGPKNGAIVGSIVIWIGILWSIPLILSPLFSIIVPIVLGVFDIIIVYWTIRMILNPTKQRAFSTKLWLLRSMLVALFILAIDQFRIIYLT